MVAFKVIIIVLAVYLFISILIDIYIAIKWVRRDKITFKKDLFVEGDIIVTGEVKILYKDEENLLTNKKQETNGRY